jgi:putative Mg2+ transporter-C (MgtC) family protein
MTYEIIITRILVAILLGSVIGLERQLNCKVAGIKTHILVCVGSTVFTLLSLYGFTGLSVIGEVAKLTHDPARIAAQIIPGIGFIGAGAIWKSNSNVVGITTASTLWITASVGMAVGSGYFFLSIFTTFAVLFSILIFRHVESKFINVTEKE